MSTRKKTRPPKACELADDLNAGKLEGAERAAAEKHLLLRGWEKDVRGRWVLETSVAFASEDLALLLECLGDVGTAWDRFTAASSRPSLPLLFTVAVRRVDVTVTTTLAQLDKLVRRALAEASSRRPS
jgi:hypothetical protein